MYDVTLKSSYISQNYNADTIDTDLTLNAVATSKNSEQVITLGHIYIDNVKPVGEYESAVQKVNEAFFGGFYGIEHRMVTIEGVSPDIDLNQCEIQTNDYVLKYEDGGFDYDADAHTISFMIEKGWIVCKMVVLIHWWWNHCTFDSNPYHYCNCSQKKTGPLNSKKYHFYFYKVLSVMQRALFYSMA